MRTTFELLVSLAALVPLVGCAATQQVRYVYQDGEFGVIGMPENTDRWPTHYRRQAEKMMASHFPEGHKIVRAEEVVEGSRTLTTRGTTAAELVPEFSSAGLAIAKLGRTASRSQADQLKIKECRIVYRRSAHTAPPALYAERPSLNPTKYVDPNDIEHLKEVMKTEKPKEEPKLDEAHRPAPGRERQEGAAGDWGAAGDGIFRDPFPLVGEG